MDINNGILRIWQTEPKITRIIGLLKLNIIECIADLGLRNNTYNKNENKKKKNKKKKNFKHIEYIQEYYTKLD